MRAAWLGLLVLVHDVRGLGLRADPIVGTSTQYLDGSDWMATSSPQDQAVKDPAVQDQAVISVPATVPGDLITDLERAGIIGDPLFEQNFLNGSSTWNLPQWRYTKSFKLDPKLMHAVTAGEATLLVFDGIKMGARISLNGKYIGTANDQFLRYSFPVDSAALLTSEKAGAAQTLSVTFDTSIDCGGRWMACTGGWDWAPYSYTRQDGANTFSKGIWKSVYLTTVESAAITSVVAHTFYLGECEM